MSEQRLTELEQWRSRHAEEHKRMDREAEASGRRLKDEITTEVGTMTKAAIAHVEAAVKTGLEPVAKLGARVDAIKLQNDGQTKLLRRANRDLRAAREERIRRAGAEEHAAAEWKKTRSRLIAATPFVLGLLGLLAALLKR